MSPGRSLIIRQLQKPDAPRAERFLRGHLESSLFLLSNLRRTGFIYRGRRGEMEVVGAFRGGTLVGVVGHAWNGNLVLQAPRATRRLVLAAVQSSGRTVKGIVGPLPQARAALAALNIGTEHVQTFEAEHLFSLRLDRVVVPPALSGGNTRIRRAVPRDVPTLTRWFTAYEVEALGAPRDRATRDKGRARAERLDMFVLECRRRLVSTASFNAALPEIVQVGGVYTPPKQRGRGFARAVVAGALLWARRRKVKSAVLFTGVNNVPALRAYRALGFRQIGSYGIVLLR